ncbi:MAG: class I SAM-dependent methyltransferase [Candidatus Cloacimonetes bacterium]|nr:class I SAM-dependent methyltransferase [Candidatus Cloacimonadota bacterium]
MGKGSSEFLFNIIAPIYGLFYYRQRKRFSEVLKRIKKELDLTSYETIIDVGCGTGALCSVLFEKGLSVTGIDPAEKMLKIAMNKLENKGITFVLANVLEKLPFDDNCFDISIASYVAHGMGQNERKLLYTEMSRVTRSKVIIYDYNENRSLLTTIIEWLERGDYFHFIKNAESEMKTCVSEMKACFSEVKVVNVDVRAAWYICTPV